MLSFPKEKIKRLLRSMGLDVQRYNATASPSARLIAGLRHFKIDIVVDIGANEGQFGRALRSSGYVEKILSFEPMTAAHSKLMEVSRADPYWEVYPRCALGAHVGEVELNISGNSVSSSILPMLEKHINAAPGSEYLASEATCLTTVDAALQPYLADFSEPLLKIDTQGYEWHVLDGAAAILPAVRGILLELSLVELYEGQHLWRECIDRLEAHGFSLWSLEPAFIDEDTGRTLQWDGLFFRL